MEEEVGHMQQTIEQMEKSCDHLYAPCDPDPLHSPVCRNLTQRQGYLYVRKWVRRKMGHATLPLSSFNLVTRVNSAVWTTPQQ